MGGCFPDTVTRGFTRGQLNAVDAVETAHQSLPTLDTGMEKVETGLQTLNHTPAVSPFEHLRSHFDDKYGYSVTKDERPPPPKYCHHVNNPPTSNAYYPQIPTTGGE